MRGNASTINDFYCLNCGKKGIPLPRPVSLLRSNGHRKKMYCPFCKIEVNHIECSSYEEKMQFIEDFNAGKYKEEAINSINFVKSEVV